MKLRNQSCQLILGHYTQKMFLLLNGMEKVYKTKIAIWLICAIIGFTVIPIIPVLVYDFSWIVVTIVALILFFALFSLFDIRYTIHNNILSVKCGMLSTTNYDINQIRKITQIRIFIR